MIASVDTYSRFSDFYDLYIGKFKDDLDFYKTYCNPSDKLIEIGSGTGRILEYFLKQNYEIVGVDVSQKMLDKSEEKLGNWIESKKLTLIKHDFTLNKLNNCFDKALLTFFTFNYIIEKPVDFLQHIYESLNDNGVILIDLFYPRTFYDKTLDNFWIQNDYTINGKKIRINDNRHVIDNVERRQQIFYINNRKIKINTDRKYYSPGELKGMLEIAGFKDIQFALDYNLKGFKNMIDENKLKKNFIVKARK
jgi:SAM-dependent methyltransferase